MVYLELIFFVYCSVVQGILGIKVFSKWIYGDLQMLVSLKWCVGSNILDKSSGKYLPWHISLLYSYALLMNGLFDGVLYKWDIFPWKYNHLLSRKHDP